MDETPKCSHDLEPITQRPTKKDQSASREDQKVFSKDHSTETMVIKEQPVYSEDQSNVPKTQTVLTKDHLVYSIDQAAYSKDQRIYSKEQTFSSKKHESCSSEEQTLTKIHIDSMKDESASSIELTTESNIRILSTKNESVSLRPPENVESVISLRFAKVTSPTLAYSKNCYLASNAPLKICSSNQNPVTSQPAQLVALQTQPQTLFLQALSKLNESSLTLSVLSHFRLLQSNSSRDFKNELGDITPPDSLTSAPPTYSFVLRQMAVRRRPRFMGTFFPSPSFVQRTPPPTYAGAFDVYIEPALPPPPARVYTFGFASMPIVCPECGYMGMTVVTSRVTVWTHLCAFILCLLCCWICAPLPYLMRSCKDVYHYCSNCRSFLGVYCPTNPESVYPNV